jgi:hypothetical protein
MTLTRVLIRVLLGATIHGSGGCGLLPSRVRTSGSRSEA